VPSYGPNLYYPEGIKGLSPGVLTPGYRSPKTRPKGAAEGFLALSVNKTPRLKPRRKDHLSPLQHLQPRGRGVQFGLCAVLPHSNPPSLRAAGFEDEDEYEATPPTDQNPTRHSSQSSLGISPRNRDGRCTRCSALPLGQMAG